MKSVITTDAGRFIVDGATIRVVMGDNTPRAAKAGKIAAYSIGIVSILPKVQVAIGSDLDSFIKALELSRIPIALQKTLVKGAYSTYNVLRLQTGSIPEVVIATLSVFNGVVIGVTYSRSILENKEFRQFVRLSAMHQLSACNKGDKLRLVKATSCISTLTGIRRERLVVIETPNSLRVKVPYESKYKLPVHYTFTLDKHDRYNLLQIAYNFNDIAEVLKKK